MDNSSLLSSHLLSPLSSYPITVLLIDDQLIVGEAVKRMLKDQSDIAFHFCSDPTQALSIAEEIKPTVILQDLVMPDFNGLLLVKYFRANLSTHNIPIIVLSTKEDPQTKADAFSIGANDYIVKLPDPLELIARIRYHSNAYIRLLERNEAFRKLEESQRLLNRELAEAAGYVKSLLPIPLNQNIISDWRFIPSLQLGGDAFGYHWLDERYFAIYLLDVCGHGVGAALHSISVMNVLRSQNLPKADFHNPSSVLEALNQAFKMESHNNMFFTIWYGVYDKENNEILYSSGGHPPALLITGESFEKSALFPLKTSGIVIGAIPDGGFQNAICKLQKYNLLYIFSDGVFEISKKDGTMMDIHEFTDWVKNIPEAKKIDLDHIVQHIQSLQGKNSFEDDFSILKISFS